MTSRLIIALPCSREGRSACALRPLAGGLLTVRSGEVSHGRVVEALIAHEPRSEARIGDHLPDVPENDACDLPE